MQVGYKVHRAPTYDLEAVEPLRDELKAVGFEDLRTPEDVDRAIETTPGTVLAVINSVCGCAAGTARPGVAMALQHNVIPDRLITVFAGMEYEAVDRVRERHVGHAPSSPSVVLFKDGRFVQMLERHQIEGRTADQIAGALKMIFDAHCKRQGPSTPAEQFAKLEFVQRCGSSIPLY